MGMVCNIKISMQSFGGLDSSLRYYEFELDSYDAVATNSSGTPPFANDTPTHIQANTVAQTKRVLNWPLYQIGGKRPLSGIAAIKILEVQIPFSYFVFNALNNSFTGTYNGGGSVPITIPVGNYTTASLATALQVAIRSAFSIVSMVVTYTTATQTFLFTDAAHDFTFTFGVVGDRGFTNPRLWIGFASGTILSASQVMASPFTASCSGPNYLYVNSLKLGQLTNIYLPRGSSGAGNAGPQMAKVPVNVTSGGTIYWQDPGILCWVNG